MLLFSLPLSELSPAIDHLTSLGAAGLMGAMWLWERRNSQKREQQIDEAHTRILSDRVQLSELLDVVRQNTEAMMRLASSVERKE